MDDRSSDSLKTFLKIGSIGFGGPIAIIALLEKEFVEKRKWITEKKFQELYTAIKLFPGAVAFQMVLAVARQWLSIPQVILAGVLFLLPSFLMALSLIASIQFLSSIQSVAPVLKGLQLGAFILVLQSVFRFSKSIQKNMLSILGVLATAVLTYFTPQLEPILIIGFGVVYILKDRFHFRTNEVASLFVLFWVCFKTSFLVFGTGIAIVPMLQSVFVQQNQWLNADDFLNALTIGQSTPGPILITSSVLGYQVAGVAGVFATTIGTFLPGLLLVLLLLPRIETWMNQDSKAALFSQGAWVAVMGGLLSGSLRLGQNAVPTVLSGVVGLVLFALTFTRFNPPAPVFIILGGVVGYFVF